MSHTRDITIVGLDVAQWLVDVLLPQQPDSAIFDLLVIDEVSRLRNPKGERAKALAKIAGHFRMIWGLSGTLRPSGPEDLFMPARVVTKGKLWGRSFYKWRKERLLPASTTTATSGRRCRGKRTRSTPQLAPYVATVAEGELVQPEPTIILDKVELPPDARRQYDSMERKLLAGAGEAVIVAANAAVATGKLAQMANGFVYDETEATHRIHPAKREWLEDIIADAAGPDAAGLRVPGRPADAEGAAARTFATSDRASATARRRGLSRVERRRAAVHGAASCVWRPWP